MTRHAQQVNQALLLFLLAVSGFYVLFFDAFTVPSADFFSFLRQARNYMEFEAHHSYKRLPVFPILMGLLSRGMSGPKPFLLAAELLNLLLAPACLWLIFRIARRLIGSAWAFTVMGLCAVNQTMVFAATQPLLEMVLLTSVLLTIDLSQRGSRWAYLAVSVASMTRYEAAVLIPALVVQDVVYGDRQRRGQSVLLGALASVGIMVWMGLSAAHHPMINPYVRQVVIHRGVWSSFPLGLLRIAADFVPGGVFRLDWLAGLILLAEVMLFCVGAGNLFLHDRSRVLVTGLFFVTYCGIHIVFPFYQSRFCFPVLWVFYVGMAKGIQCARQHWRRLGVQVSQGMVSRMARRVVQHLVGWSLGVVLCYIALRLSTQWAGLGAFLLAMLSVCWLWKRDVDVLEAGRVDLQPIAVLLVCVCIGLGMRSATWAMNHDSIRFNRAQLKAVARWYQKTGQPGDKMVVALPEIVGYYSGLGEDRYIHSKVLNGTSIEALMNDLLTRRASYVVWDSDYARHPDGYYGRKYRVAALYGAIHEKPEVFEEVARFTVASKSAVVYRFLPSHRLSRRREFHSESVGSGS